MELLELMRELGPLTVLAQLSTVGRDLGPLQQEVARVLPIVPPMGGEAAHILRANLAKTLAQIPELDRKHRIVVAGPELLLLEVLGDMRCDQAVIVAVDNYLSPEMVARISANIPSGLAAQVLQVPEVPPSLRPSETVMVAIGFDGGCGHTLIVESARAILNFYQSFYFGEVVLLNPLDFAVFGRAEGWVTVTSPFTQHINPGTPQEVRR